MHNAIDFSKLERITPRTDSWDKVCARLDQQNGLFNRFLRFPIYSAIPLAASFLLVGLSVFMTAFNHTDSSIVPMQSTTSSEISAWYGSLGSETSDDLETLDESETISYLLKETK